MEVEASVFREAAGWLIVRRSRALARSGGRAVEGGVRVIAKMVLP